MKKQLLLVSLLFTLSVFCQEQMEVYFDFNKFNINPVAAQKLNNWVATNNNMQITKIYGFCDSKGSNPFNDSLSLKRVRSVYDYVTNHGILVLKDYENKGFGEDFKQAKIPAENRKATIYFEKKAVVLPPPTVYNTLKEELVNAKIGVAVILKNLYFKNKSPVIVNNSRPILYELLCIMEENPNLKIQIQGHICCQLIGDFEDVSTARARAVYVFLLQNKINRKRLSYKGFGISKPIHAIPEQNDQQADENRRVEIQIIEK